MSNIKLITVCSHIEHATGLIKSAKKHGWDLSVIHVPQWGGFGTKLMETYNFLKANPEIERFVFADAYDVIILGSPREFSEKIRVNERMLLSAERGLWPPTLHPFRSEYADKPHRFNYPNSGLYFAQSWYFINFFEKYTPFYEIDDQYWMNIVYLLDSNSERPDIAVDFDQVVFNSHSFIDDGEYGYLNGRLQILGNNPIFSHKNGKTIDPKLDELI